MPTRRKSAGDHAARVIPHSSFPASTHSKCSPSKAQTKGDLPPRGSQPWTNLDQYIGRVVDLIEPEANQILRFTVEEVREHLQTGAPDAIRGIHTGLLPRRKFTRPQETRVWFARPSPRLFRAQFAAHRQPSLYSSQSGPRFCPSAKLCDSIRPSHPGCI